MSAIRHFPEDFDKPAPVAAAVLVERQKSDSLRSGDTPMALIQEIDYGTPQRIAETLVTLEIDGKPVTVPRGTSVMRAAVEAGVQVPKLCATDNMEAFGSCRLCLVEIEGRRGTPASCTTLAEPGMKVRTQSPKIAKLRRGVMELYISDHPLDCLTCAANGDCELQDMAGRGRVARSPLRLRRRESSQGAEGRIESLFHVRSFQVHRLLALRARLRRSAGNFRAHHPGPRLRIRRLRPVPPIFSNRNASPAARACKPAPPRR